MACIGLVTTLCSARAYRPEAGVSSRRLWKGESMRTVGKRKERPIGLLASGTLLAEGARFNDEIHRLPTGETTFIPKGVYRFKTHEDANRHQLDCLAKGMAKIALE